MEMEVLYNGLCICPILPLIVKKKKALSKEFKFDRRGNVSRVCNHKVGC